MKPCDAVIETVLLQHADAAAALWLQRSAAVAAPHYGLRHLARHDDRLAANLDGLAVAGEAGWRLCLDQLDPLAAGDLFAPVVLALASGQPGRLGAMVELVESQPALRRELTSACGWTAASALQGSIRDLLAADSPVRRQVGIACCALHRVDPGPALSAALGDADSGLRARALKAAGELGRRDLLAACLSALEGQDERVRGWASWSAVLLGDRQQALATLAELALVPGPMREQALQLALKTLTPDAGHALLQRLAGAPANLRTLIQGAGIAGDPRYIPWLIGHMSEPALARVAGEAFCLITGLDLALLDLDTPPPAGLEFGPNDDPADRQVAMDADDGLPWPALARVEAWWAQHSPRFRPGLRYFLGEPLSPGHCAAALRTAFQRQRIAAAHYLSLLQPGLPLFNTAAPAWRQQRLLAAVN